MEDASDKLKGAADVTTQLQSTESLLENLRGRIAAGLRWEVKRQLVDALVGGIRIDTTQDGGDKRASIVVTYRFASVSPACTDARADSNWCLQRIYRPPQRQAKGRGRSDAAA